MRLLYLFIIVLLLKLFINVSKYVKTKWYLQKYYEWLQNGGTSLLENKTTIIKLLKDAGIKDEIVGSAEPVGFGYVRTGNASVFDNFPNAREDVFGVTRRMFHDAIGVYRSRIFETFSPLFWIEFVINLPKRFLTYLGLSPESIVIKLSLLFWWIFAAVFGFVYALYKSEVENAVRTWMGKIIQ